MADRNEIAIIIKYLTENADDLEKAKKGIEELTAKSREIFASGDRQRIQQFTDQLKQASNTIEAQGKKLTENQAGMSGLFKGMADEASRALPSLNQHLDETGKHTEEAHSKVELYKEGFAKLKEVAVEALGAIGIALSVHGLLDLAKEAATSEALGIGLKNVSENAGIAAEQVEKIKKSVEDLGVTSNTAARNLTQLFVQGISADTAQQLAESSKRLADAFGVGMDEAFDKVLRAASRQSTFFLRTQFGIFLDAERVFLQKAQELGRPVLPSERPQVFAQALAGTINAVAGASNAGIDSAQSKLRDFVKNVSDLRDHLGQILLPAFKLVVDAANSFVKSLDDVAGSTRTAGGLLDGLKFILEGLAEGIKSFTESLRESGGSLGLFLGSITIIGAALLALVAPITGTIVLVTASVTAIILWAASFERGRAVLTLLSESLKIVNAVFEGFQIRVQQAVAAVELFWAKVTGGDVDTAKQKLEDLTKKAEETAERMRTASDKAGKAINAIRNPTAATAASATNPIFENVLANIRAANKKTDEEEARRQAALRKQREQDAIEELKRNTEIARAQDQARIARLKIENQIEQDHANRQEAIDKGAFDRGLISLQQFYDARLARQREANERLENEARLAAEVAGREAVRVATLAPGSGQATAAAEAAKNAQESVKAAVVKGQTEITKITEEFEGKRVQISRQAAQLVADTLVAADSADLAARIAAIDVKFDALQETLGKANKGVVDFARNQEKLKAAFEVEQIALQRTTALMQNQLDIRQAIVQGQLNRGILTESEAMDQLNANIQQQINLRQQNNVLLQAQLASGKLLPEQAQQVTEAIQKNQLDIIKLADQIDTYGKRIQQGFTQNLITMFNDIGDRTKKLGDLLRDFALNTVKQLQNIISTNSAQAITRAIVENTGGAGKSIFDKIGTALGGGGKRDGSTAANAIWVQDVASTALGGGSGGANLPNLFDVARGKGGVGAQEQEDAKQLVEMFGDGIEKGTDDVGNRLAKGGFGILGLMNSLGGALSKIFSTVADALSSATSGSGGGGFFGWIASLFGGGGAAAGASSAGAGDLLGAFATFAAAGGLLAGPSHAMGGQLVVAEGGEFITRKEATARWFPLLAAINSGALDAMSASFTPSRRFFATGGMVSGGAMHGGDTNVEINIDNAGSGEGSTQGNNERAAALGQSIRAAVQKVLLDEKRSGGILNPSTPF